MSNNAMSNETDLDWLARNVHVWKSGYDLAVVQRGGGEIYVTWPSVCSSGITKKQWLARRAELQNKPSWSEIQDWVNWIAQSSTGLWFGSDREPEIDVVAGHSFVNPSSFRLGVTFGDGEVLGDWRDTLEKRPADLSEQAVTSRLKEATDNVLAAAPELMTDKYKFEPFVSVEDEHKVLSELEMLAKVSHLISDKRHRITPSKYTKTIHGVSVDVYDVLQAWGVGNPALQHLIKKALQCGQRGHKGSEQDLQDIIDSAIRAKELG